MPQQPASPAPPQSSPIPFAPRPTPALATRLTPNPKLRRSQPRHRSLRRCARRCCARPRTESSPPAAATRVSSHASCASAPRTGEDVLARLRAVAPDFPWPGLRGSAICWALFRHLNTRGLVHASIGWPSRRCRSAPAWPGGASHLAASYTAPRWINARAHLEKQAREARIASGDPADDYDE